VSGHNKWSKIKRGKESKDKARGNIFSKFSRLITLAVIEGGGIGDQANNIKLRLAVDKAKQFNMPKDNINRAIERASGPDRAQLKEVFYEGFAPGGVALIIQATTDNANRTLSEIRNILEKHQGKLGSSGSVNYLFQRCGLVVFEKNKAKQEQVLEFAEKIDAFDIDEDEETFSVYFSFENLGKVDDFLAGLKANPPELDYKPNSIITISDKAMRQRIVNLIDAMEDLDEVHKVFSNLNFVCES